MFNDFRHPSLNDLRQRAKGNLLGLASCKPRDADNFIRFGFLCQSRAKLLFELLCLALHDLTSLSDVVADDIATEGDDSGVADDAILENRDVGGATSDVDQCDTSFFLLFRKHRSGRGQRLKDELVHLEASFADALVDVLCGGHLSCDDVEIGF